MVTEYNLGIEKLPLYYLFIFIFYSILLTFNIHYF